MQVTLELPDQGERETQFCLGAGGTLAEAQSLIQRFRQAGAAHSALEGVRVDRQQALGAISVETPDPSANLMANGWLLYQALAAGFGAARFLSIRRSFWVPRPAARLRPRGLCLGPT